MNANHFIGEGLPVLIEFTYIRAEAESSDCPASYASIDDLYLFANGDKNQDITDAVKDQVMDDLKQGLLSGDIYCEDMR